MNTETLEQIGLTRNEGRVYETLLRKGQADSAQLSRESGVHRINVYDVLNSLMAKGLASYVLEGRKRLFKPEDPQKLAEILSAKSARLATILPELVKEFNAKKEPLDISILRGVEGKRTQFEEIGRYAQNTFNYTFIPHGLMTLHQPPYNTVLKKFYTKIAKQGVDSRLLVLDSPDARKRAEFFSGIPKIQIRFSKDIIFTAVSWNVCNDLLYLTFFIEPYLVIRIRSKEIAQAFYTNFNLMWKNATK